MTPFLWILALTTTLTAPPATQTGATQGSTPNTLTLPEGAPPRLSAREVTSSARSGSGAQQEDCHDCRRPLDHL